MWAFKFLTEIYWISFIPVQFKQLHILTQKKEDK